jgi:ABC-type histidine transport system ATPase subunit
MAGKLTFQLQLFSLVLHLYLIQDLFEECPVASLGYELKQAREAKGVTLTQLAENTRIGIRFLQAIESDDFK